ncbi:HEAT repeat domain-containing protein [Dolichospermum flos-aquae]|uniref:HEAT repeat domain-containing protein n=1 Tax=Dolichospermum flos-aquae LEGE 04289 TaxID=1828708 RepID=A0ACC5Q523_DOLFA|nr:HEAT repeat domain-containing protein [Dolichospermum flos-aquae]MBE9219688.1 HEAT repeat domain-containing protein [Dolichospermum flos-aquae LEGE 04289]
MTKPGKKIVVTSTILCYFFSMFFICPVYSQALGQPKIEAEIQKLKSRDLRERQDALKTLKQVTQESIPVLIKKLRESKDPEIQSWSAWAIGQMGVEAKIAVPDLVNALKSQNEKVQLNAVEALKNISPDTSITLQAKDAVSALTELINKNLNEDIQIEGILTLGNIGTDAKTAINSLQKKLKSENVTIRAYAAWALGNIKAKEAIPDLINGLKDENPQVRNYAATSLGMISESLRDSVEKFSNSELDENIKNFEQALENLKQPNVGIENKQIEPITKYLIVLEKDKKKRNLEVLKRPEVLVAFAYLIFFPGLWSMFLWLRPVWLLKINQILKPYTDFQLPGNLGGIKVSVRSLLLVEFFNYHPRVLDAWVKQSIHSIRKEFQQKNTVRDRQIYIRIPVMFEDQILSELTAKDLRQVWTNRACLLIWGEGGAGKTSLACQIANWAMAENTEERLCNHLMLPILIEQELDPALASGKSPFLEAIRGQLQDLTNMAEPIPEELLERLLRDRYILVIIDHFSEMSEATRKAIRPELPDFPVNALIITSRQQETLGQVTKSTLKPLRIEENRLSSFMQAYLLRRSKRELFSDSEFFSACTHLSSLVGQRTTTVLLARMYAEQMIAAKTGTVVSDLPDTVPDLMLLYLNELNREAATGQPDNRTVQQDAKVIAWECLKRKYSPSPIKRNVAITAIGGDDVLNRLKYLEERLHIIQTIGAAQDLIKFSLDPLAEYLAALQMIDLYNQNESEWYQFFMQIDSLISSQVNVQGFLLALQDCCLSNNSVTDIPAFIDKELKRRISTATPKLNS